MSPQGVLYNIRKRTSIVFLTSILSNSRARSMGELEWTWITGGFEGREPANNSIHFLLLLPCTSQVALKCLLTLPHLSTHASNRSQAPFLIASAPIDAASSAPVHLASDLQYPACPSWPFLSSVLRSLPSVPQASPASLYTVLPADCAGSVGVGNVSEVGHLRRFHPIEGLQLCNLLPWACWSFSDHLEGRC